jgi:hypothetical protein
MDRKWSVILINKESNKRFVLGYRIIIDRWEYFFYTFIYDKILNHMNNKPETFIYYYYE